MGCMVVLAHFRNQHSVANHCATRRNRRIDSCNLLSHKEGAADSTVAEMITAEQLGAIMPYAHEKVPVFLVPLNAAMQEFSINTPRRMSAFIAQVAHESGELRYMEEIADGSAYEGRLDLGNTQPGDGRKFKGHGLLDITGRTNHALCGAALGMNLETFPELITQPIGACRSAGWFWTAYKKLNDDADFDRFGSITHKVNGGYNGLDSRLHYWLAARKVFQL